MTTPTATIMIPYHALDDLIQRGTRAAQPDAADVVPGTLYGVTDEGDVVERSNGTAWEPYGATGSGGGTGDVVGPASATDNAIALFDGPTGKLLDAGPNGTLSGSLAVGTNSAQSGAIRLANNQAVVARSVGNNLDLPLLSTNTGNDTVIGNSSTQIVVQNVVVVGANYLEFAERGVPPVPNADRASLYLKDVAGTSELALQRSAGVASQIATLPIDLGTGVTGALPVASLPAHHTNHEPGGSDALTALSASILTTGTVPVARLGAGTWTVVDRTETGTIHNWVAGLAGNTLIRWAGLADLTLTGLAGGVLGQLVTLKNLSPGMAVLYCPHASVSSDVDKQWINVVGSAPTPIAYLGSATYLWVNRWELIAHEQGALIPVPFNAANFTADVGSFTVEAGDQTTFAYALEGTQLTVDLMLNGVSVSGSPTIVRVAVPGGFQIARSVQVLGIVYDNVSSGVACLVWADVALPTQIKHQRLDNAAFQNATNASYLRSVIRIPVI